MLMRLTIFLFIFSASLTAQSDRWRSYLQTDALVGGAEAEGYVWLATLNSVAKIDPRTGRQELLHFQNSPVPKSLVDIHSFDENSFALLSLDNKLLLRQEERWTTQTLNVPDNDGLRHIIGQTTEQELLLIGNTKLYGLTTAQELEYLPYGEAALSGGYIAYAELDRQDYLWLGTSGKVVQLAPDGSILQELDLELDYFVDAQLDENDNLWVTTRNNIYLWLAVEQRWEQLSGATLGIDNPNTYISAVIADRAVISNGHQTFNIRYTDAAFQFEEWSSFFAPNEIPIAEGFLDQSNHLWYWNYGSNLKRWQVSPQRPQVHTAQPWLPFAQLLSLGLDPQGKIWAGGIQNTAYLSGGRWNTVPVSTDPYPQIGINAFTFNPDGNPLIGTGYLFFFGMPDCGVRQLNDSIWERQSDSIIAASFRPITDLHWDDNDYLWVLQSFNTFFFVRSRGVWHTLRTIDVSTPTASFTCLTPDPAGGMWIGTDNGIRHYDGYVFTSVNGATMQSEGYPVVDIAIDDLGKKWVTLGDGGLRRETEEGWVVVAEINDLGQNQPTAKVVCGKYPEVWVSLDWNGLLHFDGSTWEYLTVENSGIIDNNVINILRDNDDRMWFAHYRGISVYSPDTKPITPYYLPDQQAIGVYPNPGCCLFTVHWKAVSMGDYELQLHNTSGQLVRQWKVTAEFLGEQTLSFQQDDLPGGSYFLTVSQNEHQIGTATIVVLQ